MRKANLIKAFKFRNKLEEKITKHPIATDSFRVYKESSEEENKNTFNGLTFKEVLDLHVERIRLLSSFKQAIEKANVIVKPLIIELECVKFLRKSYSILNENIKSAPTKHINSKNELIIFSLLLNQEDILKEIKKCDEKVEELEDQINNLNVITIVDFDINTIKAVL